MIKVEMNYIKVYLYWIIYLNMNLKLDLKVKLFNKNYLIKVLRYVHIARRSRYYKIIK